MKSTAVDLSRHISLQINALKLFGVWFYIPYSAKTFQFWFGILSRVVLGILVFVIPTGGQLVYVVRLIVSGNAEIQEIAGIMNLVLTELLASLRLLDLRLRRDFLSRLSGLLISEEFQCHSKPHKVILERAVRISRWLFWGMWCSCVLDISVHVIVVPALNGFRALPLKMDLIWFDVNHEAYFNYIFIYQIVYKPMMLTTFVALSTLPWAAMSCAISQLDVLIYNFENMRELVKATAVENRCDGNEAFKEVFKRCVLHHRSIIRFINMIQAAFGGQLSSTLFLNACIICTTAVQIFSVESSWEHISEVIWILAYLVIILSNLFIDCYFGNTLSVKGMHVAEAVFSCPWVDLPTELQKNLALFIMKTQRPIVITAAKLVPVSFETFTKPKGVHCWKWASPRFATMTGLALPLMLLLLFSVLLYVYVVIRSLRCYYQSLAVGVPVIREKQNIRTPIKTTKIYRTQVMNWTYKGFAIMNQMKK